VLSTLTAVALVVAFAWCHPSRVVLFAFATVALATAVGMPVAFDAFGRTRPRPRRERAARASVPEPTETGIGVGTVRTVTPVGDADLPEVVVDVETVTGQRFEGTLTVRGQAAAGRSRMDLRPGVVLAVRFDPGRTTEVTLADDMVAARAAFDTMLIRKGLTTPDKLDLIRRGTKSHGVVTAMRLTGQAREDFSEVQLDVMVSRPEGGQFPVREVTFIPGTSVAKVEPGSVIDTYYRSADPSRIAVCVPRS
jgi:hypothetical protein